MKSAPLRDRFMPWGGLALGTLGAGLAHQIGAESTFQDCTVGSPWIVIAGTVIGLALIAVGAIASYRVFRGDAEGPSRRLVAAVSLLASALFVMAVLLPMIAALLIPQCWA